MKNQVKKFSQFVNENKSRSMFANKVSTKQGFHQTSLGAPFGSHGNMLYNTVTEIMKADTPEEGVSILEDALEILIGDETFMENWKGYTSKDSTANVELSRGMGGGFATITFNGDERDVDELESLRATWQNILDIANEMGADLIYSVEDEEIISQADIDKLDNQPSGW